MESLIFYIHPCGSDVVKLTLFAMLGLAPMDSILLANLGFFILQAYMSAVSPYYKHICTCTASDGRTGTYIVL